MLSRIFQLLLIASFATSPLQAKTDPFIGQWKLIKLTDQMKVTKVGANTYAFDFGVGPETIVVDGTDQAGYAGTTLSVAADGANWKVIRKKGNRVMLTATWSLSEDGNSLKDDFIGFGQDGSRTEVKYLYARKAAGSRFAGTWVSTAAAVGTTTVLQVRPYESNGLSFITPSRGQKLNVTFDGKNHPGATAGSISSARQLNARTVEISLKSKGKVTQVRLISLSPDLNTLTITVQIVGVDQPYIYVYERQRTVSYRAERST